MRYQVGEEVVWLHDGQEFSATVLSCGTTHDEVEFYQIEVEGAKKHVKLNELLAAKKAGFEIRDLVLVLNEGRDAMQGEIVAIGSGPKDRAFYQLRFQPTVGRAQSWYSEDEVFTVSDPKKKTIPRVTVL